MPHPRTEYQAWETERAELPELIARRDPLTWTIRQALLRMAEFDARLGRADPAVP